MSIPPLVCNTPPPPEQCDDDRDAEDFDIQYNLSQEDDDDGHDYDYGTYSDYIYTTSTSSTHQDIWASSDISKKTDNFCSDLIEAKKQAITIMPTNDSCSVNKVGLEDVVLEDLNLKLEDQNEEAPIEESTNKFDTKSIVTDFDSSQDQSTQFVEVTDKNEDNKTYTTPINLSETTFKNDVKTFDENIQCIVEETVGGENLQQRLEAEENNPKVQVIDIKNKFTDEICLKNPEKIESNISVTVEKDRMVSETKLEDLTDDVFGEFDDFQFISSENNATGIITYCDNPWISDIPKNSDFGDFTANFDADDEDIHLCNTTNNFEDNNTGEKKEKDSTCDTDDFGDFDDFKSSSNEYKETNLIKNEPSHNVPVLSLYSPESEVQIIESINSVLSSIFTAEIVEPECGVEGKVDSFLNETWGHLLDTDVRQPYIVNWNNSLGQNSLLKALCIDSRNILFGPKWNNTMPKYAANLTVAPLQPKKPVTPTNITDAEDQNIDKTTNKDIGTWTDPFTSDGKEYICMVLLRKFVDATNNPSFMKFYSPLKFFCMSCTWIHIIHFYYNCLVQKYIIDTYAEALLLDLEHLMATLDQMAHKNSTFKISELLTNASSSESAAAKTRPADLDVFTDVVPQEIDRIYSSSLSAPPIRQINLPDTHIFTPTDSETPRSKTIHYDQAPPMLVPQPSEDVGPTDELKTTSKSEATILNPENEDDYWEFQDFKGGSGSKNEMSTMNQDLSNFKTTENDSISHGISNYETQILQPIKVEPFAPALNWPDPGEVKETFDDFSEFISNTLWNNENTKKCQQTDSPLNSSMKNGNETSEDDFETFQSAPLKCVTSVDNTYKTISNMNHGHVNEFPQNYTDSYDISLTTQIKKDSMTIISSDNLIQNELPITDNFKTIKDGNSKISPVLNSGSQNQIKMSCTVMQPSVTSTNGSQRTQHNTGQILQPLSLESYSQINWPSPGIDLQDLSRFNPVESLHSLKTDLSTGGSSKLASPAHKDINSARNEASDEDIWGDFVSSKQMQPKKVAAFADDDEWTDFVSSPSVKPQNGLNTISLNVHTNLNMQKNLGPNKFHTKNTQLKLDIPTLNYVTPKSNNRGVYNDKHFQNL